MATFKLTIVTPEGSVFKDQVDAVTVPGLDGYFGVLANHAPLLAAIGAGVMTVRVGTVQTYYAIAGGVLEVVRGNEVEVLADYTEEATSLDAAKDAAAKEAVALAKRLSDSELEVFI